MRIFQRGPQPALQRSGLLNRRSSSLSAYPLEQRYLLDAAAAVTFADAAQADAAKAQSDAAINALKLGEQTGPDAADTRDAGAVFSESGAEGAIDLDALAGAGEPGAAPAEIVFIDAAVENAAGLVKDINPSAEVYFLDGARDGVEQIAEILSRYDNVDAVHIISHGDAGVLNLGAGRLNEAAIVGRYADDLARIGSVLSPGGDILIYGCDFGADAQAVAALAQATGADIAASTDDTGHADLGGDWLLEASAGAIETTVAVSQTAQASWNSLLAINVSTGTDGVTEQDLLDAISPGGLSGITINTGTATLNGGVGDYYGTFTATGSNLGLDSGLILATGDAGRVGGTPSDFLSDPGTGINAGSEFDIASFSYEFTADVDKVAVVFVFGSEEYDDFVLSGFNDNFEIRLTGPNPSGGVYNNENLAVVPGTTTGISIDTINNSINSSFYRDNEAVSTFPVPDTALDGLTVPITTILDVTPGQTYTIEFRIADFADAAYDSAVVVNYFGGALVFDGDDDNSSGASGADFNINFDSAGTDIVDVDATVVNYDNLSDIQSATVTLTNGKAGDILTVDTAALAGLGISASGVPAGPLGADGSITITLNNLASEADYVAALQTIQFDTTALSPDSENRQIEIEVVADNGAASNTALTTIKVVPEIVTPIADQAADDGDAVSITANIVDPDGDTLAYAATGLPPGLAINPVTGEITGTLGPDASNGGPYTVTVTATDGNGGSVDDSFVLTVNNPAPSGTSNTVVTDEDVDYVFGATDFGFSDGGADSDALDAVRVDALPLDGTLFLDDGFGGLAAVAASDVISASDIAAGNLIFRPDADANGANYASFDFSVSDGTDFAASPSTITVDVTPVNDAPLVSSSAITVDEESLGNALGLSAPTDPDGPSSTISVTGLPMLGTVTLADGTPVGAGDTLTAVELAGLLYDAPADYDGAADPGDFTYEVGDGIATVAGAADIAITPVNDAPLVSSSAITVDEESLGNALGLSAPTDPDGPSSTISVTGLPMLGTVTLADGTPVGAGDTLTAVELAGLLYDAPADYDGAADPGDFTYEVGDGIATVAGAADIAITPVNDAPEGADATIAVLEDGSHAFSAGDFGFSDPAEGDAFESVTVQPLGGAGALFFNGAPVTGALTIPVADLGLLVYAPASNDNGAGVASVSFQVTDDGGVANGGANTDPTPNVASFDVTPVNDPPTGADNTVLTDEDADYVFSAADFGFSDPADGDDLQSVIVAPLAGGGVLAFNGAPVTGPITVPAASIGLLVYSPPANASGSALAAFSFQVVDDGGAANGGQNTDQTPRTMTIDVANVVEAPVIDLNDDNTTTDVDFTATFTENSAAVAVADSDADIIDPDDNITSLEIVLGNFVDAGSETVTVAGVAIDPGGASTTIANQLVGGIALDIAFDAGAQTITVTSSAGAGVAIPEAALDALLRGVGYENSSENPTGGNRTLSFTASDADGASNAVPAISTVAVAPVNDAPSLTGITIPAQTNNDADAVVSLDVTGAFDDVDDVALTYAASGLPAGLSIDPNTGLVAGMIDPSASQGGPYLVTVTAEDTDGATATTTFTWNVANPAPMATADGIIAVSEDTPRILDPRTNDIDPDGDPLAVSQIDGAPIAVGAPVTLASGAVVSLNPDGTLTYAPAADQNGPDSFTYTVADVDGAASSAIVALDVGAVNDAPVATGALADQSFADGETIAPLQAAPFFSDIDGDTLSFSATGLPAGLSINPATGEISGTLDGSASIGGPGGDGVYAVTVTAMDPNGETAAFATTVSVENPAPSAQQIPVQTVLDGEVLSIPAGKAFDDVDGDALVFSAAGLPDWASIDPATGLITGVAPTDASATDGTFAVSVTAQDGQGGVAAETFLVAAVNPGPLVSPSPDQTAQDGATIAPFDAGAAFDDPDGDALVFAATGLPPGLSIDPATGIVTGTLPADASQSGPYTVAVTATDADGLAATNTFVWNVENPEPSVVSPIPNRFANDGETIDFDVAPAFADVDPDGLIFAADGLPPGLAIDPETGVISGVLPPDASANEPYLVTVSADDGEGGVARDVFVFRVENANPGLVAQIGNQASANGETIAPVDVSAAFEDPDGDPLTFSATGLPPGLSIDPATGVISGTLADDASEGGPYSVIMTATDGANEIVDAFAWTVDNVAPELTGVAPDQMHADGEAIAVPLAPAFNDPDGDGLTFSAQGLPPGLSIDPSSGLVTGTLPADASQGGPYSVTLTAVDGSGESVTTAFTWDVRNIPPATTGAAPDLVNNDGDMVSAPTASFFNDADGDAVVYSATGLPPGLSIDPATGVISGVIDPSASQGGPYAPIVTATDASGDAASTVWVWTIENVAPTATALEIAVNEDAPATFDPLASVEDGDGDTLRAASINGTPVSPGDAVELANGVVTVNPNGTLTYAPDPDFNGVETLDITVIDGEGGAVAVRATIDVSPINDAPRTDNLDEFLSGAPTATVGEDLAIDVSGLFTDPEGDDLVFTAENLPPGLSIDPDTGVVAGAPTSAAASGGPFLVTITATDPDGASTSFSFTLGVNAAGADVEALIGARAAPAPRGDAAPDGLDGLDAAGGFGEIGADGVVVEAANVAGDLNGLQRLGAEGVVLSAVNDAGSLDGVGDPGAEIGRRERLREVIASVGDRFGGLPGAAGPDAVEGFSSKTFVIGTKSADPATETGQFVVDTYVRDRMLFVEVFDTIDRRQSSGFAEFAATMGDGRPLPAWISFSPDGVFMINRPAHVEAISLRITGLREDGGYITRTVEIDTPTGELRDVTRAAAAFGPGFSAGVERAAMRGEGYAEEVRKILQKQP